MCECITSEPAIFAAPLAAYDLAGGDLLKPTLIFLAGFLVFAIPFTLVGLWFAGRPAKLDAVFVLVAVVASVVVSYGLGLLYSHPAPYQLQADTLLSGPPENAFPSQHATVCFGMVWPLYALGRRQLSAGFLVIAVLVSVGRVATGLHYPVDVLGSVLASLLGFGLAWFASDAVEVAASRLVDIETRLRRSLVDMLR